MHGDHIVSDSQAYVKWKGWGDQVPFGTVTKGETDYFRRELRDATDHRVVTDVLEIGFGNGTFLAYCRSRGWHVVGTEISPESLAAGRAAGYPVQHADWVAACPDNSFDIIAAFDVLEHIPPDEIVHLLSILAVKLRMNGALIVRFPNADSWLGIPLQNGDPTHLTQIGYLKMQYFALRSGLSITAFRATRRHRFASSFAQGIHAMMFGPFISLIAAARRAIYFPGLPIVLSSPNVVCVLRRRREEVGTQARDLSI